jgi:hypothetical protein
LEQPGLLRLKLGIVDGANVLRLLQIHQLLAEGWFLGDGFAAGAKSDASTKKQQR